MSRQPRTTLQVTSLAQRIDLDDPTDCASWSRYFDVTADELRVAVRAVGTQSDEVRRYLGRQHPLFF